MSASSYETLHGMPLAELVQKYNSIASSNERSDSMQMLIDELSRRSQIEILERIAKSADDQASSARAMADAAKEQTESAKKVESMTYAIKILTVIYTIVSIVSLYFLIRPPSAPAAPSSIPTVVSTEKAK